MPLFLRENPFWFFIFKNTYAIIIMVMNVDYSEK